MPAPPPEPSPSATVLLVRDGAGGLEVLMVQRHHRVDFATGALVFPGGKLDPGDADPRLRARCAGAGGLSDSELALRAAGLRETFEEAGVLLARPRGGATLVSQQRLAALDARWREPLHRGAATLLELAESESLELALDLLVHFAHWITPEFMPRRFDTHFFLAAAPPDQLAVHDGSESVDSLWLRPGDAARAVREGRHTIIFPTLMNLQKLARSADVARALARARREPVVTVLPRVVVRDGERRMVLPAEAGYDVVEAPIEA